MADASNFLLAVRTIVADDRDELLRLIENHPDLVQAGHKGDDVFFTEIVHYLYGGDTLLHMAAAGFRPQMLQDLLSRGSDLNARNRRGAQPLHYAADTNRTAPEAQVEVITLLMKAGADPNALDKSGVSPLHRAIRTRSSAAVAVLLAGGANPRLKNGTGSTPLHLAQHTTGRGGTGTPQAKAEQAEIQRLLTAAGAD